MRRVHFLLPKLLYDSQNSPPGLGIGRPAIRNYLQTSPLHNPPGALAGQSSEWQSYHSSSENSPAQLLAHSNGSMNFRLSRRSSAWPTSPGSLRILSLTSLRPLREFILPTLTMP